MPSPIKSFEELAAIRKASGSLPVAVVEQQAREAATMPCLRCGRHPAGSAAAFSLRPDQCRRLKIADGVTAVVSLCLGCDAQLGRSPEMEREFEEVIMRQFEAGAGEMIGIERTN